METGISLMEIDCHSLVALESRGAQVAVIRRTTANGPFGIYRCDIPTDAVHDSNYSVRATVCIQTMQVCAHNSVSTQYCTHADLNSC